MFLKVCRAEPVQSRSRAGRVTAASRAQRTGLAAGPGCLRATIPNTGSCLMTLGNLSLQRGVEKCDFSEKSPPLPFLSHLPHAKPLAFGLGWLCFALCLVCLRVVLTARALSQDAASPHQTLKKDLREDAGFMVLNLFFLKQCPEAGGDWSQYTAHIHHPSRWATFVVISWMFVQRSSLFI